MLCGVACDEGAAGCFDDLAGDYGEVAGAQDAFDSDEQPVKEPEVAAGDAGDCGDGLAVGEAGVVQGAAELAVTPRSAGYRSARAGRVGGWPRAAGAWFRSHREFTSVTRYKIRSQTS